jgi:hypothetical protein
MDREEVIRAVLRICDLRPPYHSRLQSFISSLLINILKTFGSLIYYLDICLII